MKVFCCTIQDELGLHARPAVLLSRISTNYQSHITLSSNGMKSDIEDIIGVLSLNIKKNDQIAITIDGADEDAAFARIQKFFFITNDSKLPD